MTPAERSRAHALGLPAPSVGDIVSLPQIDIGTRKGRRYEVIKLSAAANCVGGWEVRVRALCGTPKKPRGYALGHIRIEQPNGAEPARLDADATAIPKTEPTPDPPTGSRKVDVRTRERNVVEDIVCWLERLAELRSADGLVVAAQDVQSLADRIRRGEWRKGAGR